MLGCLSIDILPAAASSAESEEAFLRLGIRKKDLFSELSDSRRDLGCDLVLIALVD